MSIFKPTNRMARPLGSLGALTYGNQDPDPDVQRYQSMMNTQLSRLGYNLIGTDGKLGKQSCGCAKLFDASPWMFRTTAKNWDDNLAFQVDNACDGQPFTLPTPKKKADSLIELNASSDACALKPGQVPSVPYAQIQAQLNQQLDGAGYEPIPVTGVVDPATCGAAKLIDAIANTGYQCQLGGTGACTSYITPTKKQGTPSPVVAPPMVATTTPVLTQGPSKPKISAASMVTGGLIIVGVAGIYYYAKKKGMVG